MIREIYFAAGCFWATEKLFSEISGVISATSGYANGNSEIIPNYEKVCSNKGSYKETVKVVYDNDVVSLRKLLLIYFNVIDPTVKNRQGFDMGIQYQTGIYYLLPKDEAPEGQARLTDMNIIREISDIVKTASPLFYVEIEPLKNFFEAEEYHQKYLEKNPEGYCHISKNKMANMLSSDEESLEKILLSRRYFI